MRTVSTILFAIVVGACSSGDKSSDNAEEANADIISEGGETGAPIVEAADQEPDPVEDPAPVVVPESEIDVKEPVEKLFADKYKSLKVTKSVGVRMQPHKESERYGTVAKDTRVTWTGKTARAVGCRSRWIEIEPRGWVCEKFLRPSTSEPYGDELPKLRRGDRVPGMYGKVKAEEPPATYRRNKDTGELEEGRVITASSMIKYYGDLTIDDVTYWKISPGGELLSKEHIRPYYASTWRGARIGDATGLRLPIGFTADKKNATYKVDTYKDPQGKKWKRQVPGRVPFNILEVAEKSNGEPLAYRIGEEEWVRASFMKVGTPAEPPGIILPGEKWFDVDLDSQVMIAYEGASPIYATLVSTGSRKHPTPWSTRRIWLKYAKTDMADLDDENPYSVAKVPWTQYYDNDLALHTAYWHDTFGTKRSHGCTNVAPLDARFLYFWSDPEVPPGWSMARGNADHPGSLVRVRDVKHPNPKMLGYAKKVEEKRAAAVAAGELPDAIVPSTSMATDG
jgi:lipoprotein-anchoring transpeptidase ErfK/SrfK